MPARDWQERILFYMGISVKASLQEGRNRDLTEAGSCAENLAEKGQR